MSILNSKVKGGWGAESAHSYNHISGGHTDHRQCNNKTYGHLLWVYNSTCISIQRLPTLNSEFKKKIGDTTTKQQQKVERGAISRAQNKEFRATAYITDNPLLEMKLLECFKTWFKQLFLFEGPTKDADYLSSRSVPLRAKRLLKWDALACISLPMFWTGHLEGSLSLFVCLMSQMWCTKQFPFLKPHNVRPDPEK